MENNNIKFLEVVGTWQRVDSQEPHPQTLGKKIMKKVLYYTLNDSVFCEIYAENGSLYVSAYFRNTKRALTTKCKNYKDAINLYKYTIK